MLTISACSVPATPSSRRLRWAVFRTWPLASVRPTELDDLAQGLELLGARLLVDAVEQAQALRLQRLGGGDVGEDHEVLDQPVRVEALAEGDRQDLALVGEHDAPLGEVEVRRLAQARARAPRPAAQSGVMTGSSSGAVVASGRPSAAAWAWE